MRNKKRLLATMMSLVMVMGSFTGCSGTADVGEISTTELQTEMSFEEKWAEVKEFVQTGEFAGTHMRAAMETYYDNALKGSIEQKWNVIFGVCNALLDENSEILKVDNTSYVIVDTSEIEDLCEMYFGEMLPTDIIEVDNIGAAENNNIIYSVENDVYYVTLADFGLMRFENSAFEETASDEITVTVDTLCRDDHGEYVDLFGQANVVLKYSEDTEAGFVISNYEYIYLEEELDKKTEERRAGEANSAMEKIVADEAMWNCLLGGIVYGNEYEWAEWKTVSYIAQTLDDTSIDNDEIEIVEKENEKYYKVSENLVTEIIATCEYQLYESEYGKIKKKWGEYDEGEKVFYFKELKKEETVFQLESYEVKGVKEIESQPSVYRVVIVLNQMDDKGEVIGKHRVTLQVDYSVKTNRFGVEFYKYKAL